MRPVSKPPTEPGAARIAPLATLPLFIDLKGRRAVVAGSGEAAAWKAELLAAAGAEVVILAPTPDESLLALVERGRFVLHRRRWCADDFQNAALAILEPGDEAEAFAFRTAARRHGAIVNVIDRPALSDVRFGSIVNRSPVVVGISTDGAAPVLGQAIRQRIETLLPPSLAGWAALAARWRPRLAGLLPEPAQRRRFWEAFARRALQASPPEASGAVLRHTLRLAKPATGRVTLVGAGPGDAGLLTLDAVRALQSADVILFDGRVSHEVLELARREAKRMLIETRNEAAAIIFRLARRGRHVVWLVPGDPESSAAAVLARNGLSVHVVAGIAASVPAAATANALIG